MEVGEKCVTEDTWCLASKHTHPQAHVHRQRRWFFWNIEHSRVHNTCPSTKNISIYSYIDSEWFPLGMIYSQSKPYLNTFLITKEWSGHGNDSLGKASTRENWLVKFVLWPPHVSWCIHQTIMIKSDLSQFCAVLGIFCYQWSNSTCFTTRMARANYGMS